MGGSPACERLKWATAQDVSDLLGYVDLGQLSEHQLVVLNRTIERLRVFIDELEPAKPLLDGHDTPTGEV